MVLADGIIPVAPGRAGAEVAKQRIDYKKSMADRNVCEMQKQLYNNEMTWKNQCTNDMNECMQALKIDWLIGWLTDWLTDWMNELVQEGRKEGASQWFN